MNNLPRFVLLLWLLTAAGCSQWHYQMGEPLDETAAPRQGHTMSQVLAALGPPLRLSATPSGYVMGWEYWRIRENSLGFSLGALGADFLSVDWGDARIAGQFMLVSFNREHRVSGAAYMTWDGDGSSGSAIQPLFGFAEVVEVGDLLTPLPQHDWGANLLDRLPAVLNSESRPDMGNSGIQQRGTPAGIGQQSLELQ
ncbi:hypothetical protein [Parahaliea aestuarii]|uniref:Lipoprotein n=1 Tax=Parahaliea aestuarii TaxID=1852021 RepID=A0A5C8ZTJ3_9GAMM|nr:hypothetical protein [Parahaliea aestuarii]TXS91775.1 hypothetical protein FVW59_11530 [Parahaliea aestuarii]